MKTLHTELKAICNNVAKEKNVIIRYYGQTCIICHYEKPNGDWDEGRFGNWQDVLNFLSEYTRTTV